MLIPQLIGGNKSPNAAKQWGETTARFLPQMKGGLLQGISNKNRLMPADGKNFLSNLRQSSLQDNQQELGSQNRLENQNLQKVGAQRQIPLNPIDARERTYDKAKSEIDQVQNLQQAGALGQVLLHGVENNRRQGDGLVRDKLPVNSNSLTAIPKQQPDLFKRVLLPPGDGNKPVYRQSLKNPANQEMRSMDRQPKYNSSDVQQQQGILRQVLLPPGDEKQQLFVKNFIESAGQQKLLFRDKRTNEEGSNDPANARFLPNAAGQNFVIPAPAESMGKESILKYHDDSMKTGNVMNRVGVDKNVLNQFVGQNVIDQPAANMFDRRDNDEKTQEDGHLFQEIQRFQLQQDKPLAMQDMFQQQNKPPDVQNNDAAPHDSHLPEQDAPNDDDAPDGGYHDNNNAQPVNAVVAGNDIQVQPAMPDMG